jgi:lysophospholipase L1-like esterase
VTGATSYNIYYSTTTGVTKVTGLLVSGVTNPKVINGLTPGTPYYFIVTAVNANGESAESSQVTATPYVEYVAFGDSITFGDGDNYFPDDSSLDGRNTGGGFEPILNNLLTSAQGIPHSIVKEGYGGYKSSDAVNTSLPGDVWEVLARHPNATYYLILFGTNDSDPSFPNPSGLGLIPGQPGYNNSYKDYMQRIISAITTAGKIPYLAKVPYTLDAARIPMILEYNQVIDKLVEDNGISVPPPDFYAWFEADQDLFANDLHPNGAGYVSMANLWRDALVTP